jgi:hypothetical protein
MSGRGVAYIYVKLTEGGDWWFSLLFIVLFVVLENTLYTLAATTLLKMVISDPCAQLGIPGCPGLNFSGILLS